MPKPLAQRLFALRPSLRETRRAADGSEQHLLVWGELPAWLLVDDELAGLLGLFDGRRTVAQVLAQHARSRGEHAAVEPQQALSVIEDLRRRRILTAGKPKPRDPLDPIGIANVTINLTNRCNLRCPWCYNAGRHRDELDVTALMDGIEAGRGVLAPDASFIILGGEPLLDLPRLLHAIDRAGRIFGPAPLVSTNGTLLTAATVAELARRRVEVQVSLDGATAERHDALRGRGVFERAVAGVRRLVDAGVRTILSMVYDRGSVGEMEPYLDLARSLSVAEARFIPLRSIGAAREHAERRPDQAAACEHLLEVLARRPELRSLLLRDYFTITATIFRFAAARTSCGIGRKVVFIDSDGAVYPCPNHVDEAHRAGRLTETPLARIVRGSAVMNAVRQRYQVRRFERCSTCPFRHWCAGDCRGEVVAATGDPAAPSPHCEELRRMYRRLLWLLADGDRRLEVAPSLPGGSATADAFR